MVSGIPYSSDMKLEREGDEITFMQTNVIAVSVGPSLQYGAITCDLCGYTWTPSVPQPRKCSRCKNSIFNARGVRIVRRRRFPRDFWANIDTSGGPDACWPWTGPVDQDGYGHFFNGVRPIAAHREAYRLAKGEPRHNVCHSCDNPPCCNAAHLFDGTQRENVHDAISKGRHPAARRELMVRASRLGLAVRRARKAGAA